MYNDAWTLNVEAHIQTLLKRADEAKTKAQFDNLIWYATAWQKRLRDHRLKKQQA